MKRCWMLFLFMILCNFCLAEAIITKAAILSKHPGNFFEFNLAESKLLITTKNQGTKRMPQDHLSIYRQTSHGYELLKEIESMTGESFEKPQTISTNGFHFIIISTTPSGSGGFVDRKVFWLAPDHSIQPAEFQQASQTYENLAERDELILNGGDKELFVQDNRMKFEFWLAREGDPHCCPSAGMVTGTYKVVGNPQYDFFRRKYTGKLEIQVEEFQRVFSSTASLR